MLFLIVLTALRSKVTLEVFTGQLPQLLRPIETQSRRALVLMLHRALECELNRFARLVRTRPPDTDVVVLYDDHKRQPLEALGRSLLEAVDVAAIHGPPPFHFVPFESSSAEQHLIKQGYSAEPMRHFSPYTSGFSKVAFFVWSARQRYEDVWLIESDLYVPCSWDKLIALWPMPASPRGDRMVASSCQPVTSRWSWSRQRRCNFCHLNGIGEPAREHCLLPLSAFTRGLLVETDARLRRGDAHGHHEVFLPAVCRNMSAAGRPCELQHIEREHRINGTIGSTLSKLPRKAQTRILEAEGLEQATAGNMNRSTDLQDTLRARCDREQQLIYHPIKCKGV
jgi:hypothetical protein